MPKPKSNEAPRARKAAAKETEAPVASGISVQPDTPAAPNDPLRLMGGSRSTHFNSVLVREVLSTVPVPGGPYDGQKQRMSAAVAALGGFQPKDEIEGMLAAQATALHFGSMECLRRAMIPDQPFEIASKLRKDGANLSRAMTDMLDALDRKRGKGPQVVRVERVVVHEGGQAIVGNVAAPAPAPAPVPSLAVEVQQPGPALNLVPEPKPVPVPARAGTASRGEEGA